MKRARPTYQVACSPSLVPERFGAGAVNVPARCPFGGRPSIAGAPLSRVVLRLDQSLLPERFTPSATRVPGALLIGPRKVTSCGPECQPWTRTQNAGPAAA